MLKSIPWICFVATVFGLTLSAVNPARSADPPVDFNRDIRPIISNTCYKCHGFDEAKREAGLRLDTHEGAIAKLDSGAAAVVPGKSADSEMLKRLLSTDASERMPPPESGKTVTPEQIELIKRWIDQGAKYQGHWSFVTPVRPALPEVKAKDRVRNPIDNFILARLEKEGVAPSNATDKITLIRRVTFDLTGLPPTIAEIEAFVADQSPQAYEVLVDRLLKSPRYGEHMARYWLDAARYGDTHGLHFDNERSLWPYRDWVIKSFNDNLPYDKFTTWQIAGDLLPQATLDQKVASGFNRCNITTSEGGSIADEVLARYAVDRTETMSTIFLGLTMGCAVCHDHKFDPVSQKEFYQLYAYFNSAADAAMDGNALLPAPIAKVAQPEQLAKLAELEAKTAELKKQMDEMITKIEYTDPTPAGDAAKPLEPAEFVWIDDAAPKGAKLQGDTPWKFVGKDNGVVNSGEKATTRKAVAVSQHYFTEAKPGLIIGEGDKLFAYVYLDPLDPPKTVMLQFNDGAWEHRAFWGEDLIPFGAGDQPGHRRIGDLPAIGEWVRLEVEADRVGLKPGAILNGWAFSQFGGTVHWDTAGIVTRTPQNGQGFESLAAWQAYEKTQKKSTVPKEVQDALKLAEDKRNNGHKKTIRDYFLRNVYSKTKDILAPLQNELNKAEADQKAVDTAIPASLVMADMPKPRDTFILIRGAYDKKGEKVTPGTPAVLPPLPKDAPANRLGLAQWLTDPQHPLVARVTVNRFWQQYFGTGLVKTSEDFGSQGNLPSHPELLDWLSREFIESGWDVKKLQKLIVMSGTYQQSSKITPELLKRDGANELLARGPRFRLDAEVIRDSAVFSAGLLTEKAGGRGVKTYQPEGIWEAISFKGSNTGTYKQDDGDALYRRSIYMFWKRTAPPSALQTLDAPSRESCVVRRTRTNTPLQALLLMNDQQYIEAARKLAERAIKEAGDKPADRLGYIFRIATGRTAAADELAVLSRIFDKHLEVYSADKSAAEKLLGNGAAPRDKELPVEQVAAYTMACNLILNLDETMTKE
ncbi:Planctomycete cytochrome C [Anatilimnocola aggregata]|uniref:Planctomycete cytochrome C n=1 Tax=Anatilimnocola aggregata TaxID=2528021 RepID=A0A517Y562_9BACT|nr:PSD1 and planctomycete cytochrome C domain-containing protein [Anatilimnocola aggregata]QDU25381.1 Planctomycete cytochrome C [Anatilimnocola aggregata]